jgi:thioredoxin-like negative regulator of GroEL
MMKIIGFCSWCGPCKLLTPRIETVIAEEKGKVNLAKVDIDELTDLALEYDVRNYYSLKFRTYSSVTF